MNPRFSLILPTHNRADVLAENLHRLTRTASELPGRVEIIVVDNGSTDETADVAARRFPSVRLIRLDGNRSTAARNVGVRHASAPILVMLDDDSYLEAESLVRIGEVMEADDELACVAARVCRTHPPGMHEAGGLPGAFIGCGAAVKRDVFTELGGYPEDYDYYVEEYDFCLRVWQSGRRVCWFDDIVVYHQRSNTNRDFNRIIRFLTRNNLRLWDRYAPPGLRQAMLTETVERYARIARKESAQTGFFQGLTESAHLLSAASQPDHPQSETPGGRPLTRDEFERVYGLDDARRIIEAECTRAGCARPAMYGRGKGAEQLLGIMEELGLGPTVVFDPDITGTRNSADAPERWRGAEVLPVAELSRYQPDALIVGSLSPGVCRDLAAQARDAFSGTMVIEPVCWNRSPGSQDRAVIPRCGARPIKCRLTT